MSYTMKLWKRAIEQRFRRETKVFEDQFRFMFDKSTMEVIYSLRCLMENIEINKRIYVYYL